MALMESTIITIIMATITTIIIMTMTTITTTILTTMDTCTQNKSLSLLGPKIREDSSMKEKRRSKPKKLTLMIMRMTTALMTIHMTIRTTMRITIMTTTMHMERQVDARLRICLRRTRATQMQML